MGDFFNNMTSLYDGSYAAFKIRFQWLFLSSVLVLILSVIPIVLYIFLMKGICPPFLPFSHFPEIPPLFSFFELVIWEFASNSSQEPASISTSRFSSFSHSRRWAFVSFLFHWPWMLTFPTPNSPCSLRVSAPAQVGVCSRLAPDTAPSWPHVRFNRSLICFITCLGIFKDMAGAFLHCILGVWYIPESFWEIHN